MLHWVGDQRIYLIEENKEGWETKNMMVGTLTDDDNILEIEYVAMPEDYDRYCPLLTRS
jgi:hypothetical protein